MPFLQFQPIYHGRVWGGRALADWLGREVSGSQPIGESWEIVDRSEAQSVVSGGIEVGRTLRALIEARGAEIMGPGWDPMRRFPILVKWLDCRERLSLQVHPPASVAREFGGEPKTENWYVVRATAGAAVLAGVKAGVDAAQFRTALASEAAETLVERHSTAAGDSLLIESGVMHAIDAGNVILEIQQNSDTTYRVYDWGRVGLDGKLRQLHVEQSLACFAANTARPPKLIRAADPQLVLADCREFRIRRIRLDAGERLSLAAREQVRILSVVDGALKEGESTLGRGANVLLPFADGFEFAVAESATVLITDNFTSHEID
ncbi:MAG: class I mannose-6-phosphate isomerase [Candidatus Didemnitutus sp.]|nr:class I mannose-6-phosphate isomerase [Candidatus Didemnitutus sp.]